MYPLNSSWVLCGFSIVSHSHTVHTRGRMQYYWADLSQNSIQFNSLSLGPEESESGAARAYSDSARAPSLSAAAAPPPPPPPKYHIYFHRKRCENWSDFTISIGITFQSVSHLSPRFLDSEPWIDGKVCLFLVSEGVRYERWVPWRDSHIWLEKLSFTALIYTINHLLNSASGNMTIVSTNLPHIS